MKLAFKILIISIIDVFIIWLWFYYVDPDPSISIVLMIILPTVFFINLIVAGILWINQKRKLSQLFIINSVLTVVIANYLWPKAIKRHQNKIYDTYSFNYNDKSYQISIYKKESTFMITKSENPGSFWGFQDGTAQYKKD
ncbi:hypothetical protein [Chryseobacterium sp. JK1]|uniref:hypothetical protein n=1 Tax=Chryseobacterium sp. JK1 TaxID=874294 RepID=UPI003D6902C5